MDKDDRVETPIAVAYARLAAEAPDEPALTFQGQTVTRAELERRSNLLARAFLKLGVQRDSFVTISLPNGFEFVEATLATWKAGATPQPVSSRLPARERAALLDLAKPSLAVGEGISPADCPLFASGWDPERPLGEDALSAEPLEPAVARSWKAPTSGGSTGRPKLIVTTNPATAESIARTAGAFVIEASDVALTTGPLYHNAVFGSSMAALMRGCHLVVMPRFDAAVALELIARERVSWMYAVPTMMQRIWRLPETERLGADVSSLRVVYHVAAPCPAWLKRAWIEWLGADAIWEMYGGAEAQAWTRIDGSEWLSHEGSVGRPIVGELKILDCDGAELPPGAVGEVWMRSGDDLPAAYRYIGSEPKARDSWESLGDLGRVDEDGYLYLSDRDTDMILVGGANVYPAEVEAALDEHPGVMSSCVIGLPDEDLGNVVHALVQPNGSVTEEELLDFLSERIVRYKTPRSFEFVDEPLRDDAGKVRRGALRAERIAATASSDTASGSG